MFLISKDLWEVKNTKGKGLGVFAKQEIKNRTVIGDYLGKVIKTAEYDLNMDRKGLYLMYLTDEASIYPDLASPGLHLFNHSCNPNCWIYTYKGHTLFFALKKIKRGDELTISYLISPNDGYCNPCTHDCKCGSKNCTGTMHMQKDKYNKWQEFQDVKKLKTGKPMFTLGRNLPKLDSYPKSIPYDSIYKEVIDG